MQAKWQKDRDTISKKHYQEAWGEFHDAYLEYHQFIKDNFLKIRNLVAKKWSTQKKTNGKSQELHKEEVS